MYPGTFRCLSSDFASQFVHGTDGSMSDTLADLTTKLQTALYEHLATPSPFSRCEENHGVSEQQLKRAWKQWSSQCPEAQPQFPADIRLTVRGKGKPIALTNAEEELICDVIDYYISISCPLTKKAILDMVQDVVKILPESRRTELPFKGDRPSLGWLAGFLPPYTIQANQAARVRRKPRHCFNPRSHSGAYCACHCRLYAIQHQRPEVGAQL